MRICLNMIVKNESAVIERCLRSVLPHIHCWAIVDTGSGDGTQALIRETLRDLPGELIERPWVDFAHNRNEALTLAQAHGDFALVIDADEVLEVAAGAAPPNGDAPGFMFNFLFGITRYWRIAMVRLGSDWRWEGVLHEVLVSAQLAQAQRLPGWCVRIHTDGARSQMTAAEKYSADAEVLRRALQREPGHARYAFYYAQSLRDAGCGAEALAAYRRRVDLAGWHEEVYYSKLQIAQLLEAAQADPAQILSAYLDAYDFRPQRAEAACEMARFCRLQQRYRVALIFARIASELPVSEDLLFVDSSVLAWRARDEWAVACWYCGDYTLSEQLCRQLLASAELPDCERKRVQSNLEFALRPPTA